MSYTKTNWENGATPAINAENLNKIEDELVALDADIDTAEGEISALEATLGEMFIVDTRTENIKMTSSSGTSALSHVYFGDGISGYTPFLAKVEFSGSVGGTSALYMVRAASLVYNSSANPGWRLAVAIEHNVYTTSETIRVPFTITVIFVKNSLLHSA